MTAPHTIAVLGMGRMGSAIATRLSVRGWDVVGWTRSGRPTGSVEMVGDPNEAVEKAEIVLLSLFDGSACRQVLDRVRGSLHPGKIVVNAGTIAPAEAAELAERVGSKYYVHAPLLGSVTAAAAGSLRILLAAGDAEACTRVRPILEGLGTLLEVDDIATAAALKLVANASLAGAVLALRDSLQQADALGLPRDQALDVLELGQLGGLVARKRSFLTRSDSTRAGAGERTAVATAEFAIGALAKDMALLASASNKPVPSAAELAEMPDAAGADIAVAATVPAVADDVLEPLRAYMRGHATGDPVHFRAAFLPTAHIEGIRDGAFVSWQLDEYCARFDGKPAADEASRERRIDSVRVHGTVASASMTLKHCSDTFTDVFLLVDDAEEGWRIANKAYHRHG